MPAGDVVIGSGLRRVTMPAPDGASIGMVGRYTGVKVNAMERVYLMDHGRDDFFRRQQKTGRVADRGLTTVRS